MLSPQMQGAGLQGPLQQQLLDVAAAAAVYNPDAPTAAPGEPGLPVSVSASNGAQVSSSTAAAAGRAAQLKELAEKKDLQVCRNVLP